MVMFFVALAVVIVVGDFGSTFFYHVPQHIWGKLHLRTHHDKSRSYWDHAVLSRDPRDHARRLSRCAAVHGLAAALCTSRALVGGRRVDRPVARSDARLVAPYLRDRLEEPATGWCASRGSTQIVLPEDHNGHHTEPGRGIRRPLPLLRRAGSSDAQLRSRLPAPSPYRAQAPRAHSRPAHDAWDATRVSRTQ